MPVLFLNWVYGLLVQEEDALHPENQKREIFQELGYNNLCFIILKIQLSTCHILAHEHRILSTSSCYLGHLHHHPKKKLLGL